MLKLFEALRFVYPRALMIVPIFGNLFPGIYDEFIYTHWVYATADGDLFSRWYHKPSSQHFLCWHELSLIWLYL